MKQLDPTDPAVWQQVRATVRGASASSMHCAIASIGADGRPHVTPIGSVMLTEPGRGVYLDVINVYNQKNIFQYEYGYKKARNPVSGRKEIVYDGNGDPVIERSKTYEFPFLPTIGLSMVF